MGIPNFIFVMEPNQGNAEALLAPMAVSAFNAGECGHWGKARGENRLLSGEFFARAWHTMPSRKSNNPYL